MTTEEHNLTKASNGIKSAVESILFVSGKPLKVKDIAKILEQQEFAVQAALDQLVSDRKDSGVVVLDNNGEYQLSTNSANSTIVKNFLNAELREKLTDATVEVLAIIAYRQPISKAELEAIRGVNSQYSLRNLLMRGLIEKTPNPHDARSFLYQTTTEFLMHLGLNSVKDLPEFEKLVSQIQLPLTPQAAEAVSEAAVSDQPPTEPAIQQTIATEELLPPPPKIDLDLPAPENSGILFPTADEGTTINDEKAEEELEDDDEDDEEE